MDALNVLCAQRTSDLFAIAKFLLLLLSVIANGNLLRMRFELGDLVKRQTVLIVWLYDMLWKLEIRLWTT